MGIIILVIYVSSFKIFLKTFVISGWCVAIFIGAGYYYIQSQTTTPTEIENESVPYYDYVPESKGVMLNFGTRCVYTYLDFENSSITVMINPQETESKGYKVDFVVNADYNLIAKMVDYFEGINLEIGGETLRYTGGQVVDLLSTNNDNSLRQRIILSFFSKVKEQGVGVDFFNIIITNSKTNLKMPDCYFWKDKMDEISNNINFLNN